MRCVNYAGHAPARMCLPLPPLTSQAPYGALVLVLPIQARSTRRAPACPQAPGASAVPSPTPGLRAGPEEQRCRGRWSVGAPSRVACTSTQRPPPGSPSCERAVSPTIFLKPPSVSRSSLCPPSPDTGPPHLPVSIKGLPGGPTHGSCLLAAPPSLEFACPWNFPSWLRPESCSVKCCLHQGTPLSLRPLAWP